MVFKVECKNGVVISAVKYGGDTYWNGDQLLVKLGPQIIHKFNSGGTTNSGSDSSIRDEYDNPEDLYEENRDWFDDEDEAWDYGRSIPAFPRSDLHPYRVWGSAR